VRLGDLLVDPGVRPQGDFNVVTWGSRLEPYTSYVHVVPNGAPGLAEPLKNTPLPGRKRFVNPFDSKDFYRDFVCSNLYCYIFS
jgi:hypothetical protein